MINTTDLTKCAQRADLTEVAYELQAPQMTATRTLEYLPVALFGAVMGLSGLSVAWRLAAKNYGFPMYPADGIGIAAVAVFVTLLFGYGIKTVCAPDAVRAEFQHPVAGSLFGTLLISLLLLPIVIVPYSQGLARALWTVGAIGMLGFAWLIVDRWMGNRQQVAHASPAWMVPVVGLLDVPLAAPLLGLPPMHELMVACLGIGLFFAVPLFAMIFSRLLFEPPLPPALQPTLLILVAPFAVGFLSYVSVMGVVDDFAGVLYGLTIFMLTILIGRLHRLLICCPFRLSWWAVSFPLASSAVTALRFASDRPGMITDGTALVLLMISSVVIAALSARTFYGIVAGELRALSS